MKNKILLAALRIAAINEEFTEKEILEAVKLLEGQARTSSLLTFLAGREQEVKARQGQGRKAKAIEEQRSKALIDLEYKDREKFQVLSEFDSLVRRSHVLPNVDDIKRLGEQLSKDFSAKGSRREHISKLIALMAEKPLADIRGVVESILSNARLNDKDSDYQRLAQFIMTGRVPQAENKQRA